MKKFTGQGMTEIGMLLGILVLACLGALTFLGGNTAQALLNIFGGSGGSVAIAAGGGPTGSAGGPVTGGETAGGATEGTDPLGIDLDGDGVAETLSNTDSVTPVYGEDGSVIGYEVTGYTEDGTSVTSVVGGGDVLLAMTQKMEALMNDPALRAADGTPLIDFSVFQEGLVKMQMATALREQNAPEIDQLTAAYDALGPIPDPSNDALPQKYPKEMVAGVLAITESYIAMSKVYEGIETQVSALQTTNPAAYEKISAEFSQIVNSANTVALKGLMPDVLSGLQVSRVNSSDLLSLGGQYSNSAAMIMSVYSNTTVSMGAPPSGDMAATTAYYNSFNSTFVSQVSQSVSQVAFGGGATMVASN